MSRTRTYAANREESVEYLIVELAVREALGRKIADVVLGSDCCGHRVELPEDLPELEEVTGYVKTAREKIPKSKLARIILRRMSRAAKPVEELLPEVEHLAVSSILFGSSTRTLHPPG